MIVLNYDIPRLLYVVIIIVLDDFTQFLPLLNDQGNATYKYCVHFPFTILCYLNYVLCKMYTDVE